MSVIARFNSFRLDWTSLGVVLPRKQLWKAEWNKNLINQRLSQRFSNFLSGEPQFFNVDIYGLCDEFQSKKFLISKFCDTVLRFGNPQKAREPLAWEFVTKVKI